jgi:hypothetical protein
VLIGTSPPQSDAQTSPAAGGLISGRYPKRDRKCIFLFGSITVARGRFSLAINGPIGDGVPV